MIHDHIRLWEVRRGIKFEMVLRIGLVFYLVGRAFALYRIFCVLDQAENYFLDEKHGVYDYLPVRRDNAWQAFVPIRNIYRICEASYGNGWMFLLYLVPIGRWFFHVHLAYRITKATAKKPGFVWILIFVPIFFVCDTWITVPCRGKKAIVASTAAGMLFSLWFIASVWNSGYPVHAIKFTDNGTYATVISIADETSAFWENRKVNQYIRRLFIPSRHNGMPVEQLGAEEGGSRLIGDGELTYLWIPDTVRTIYQGFPYNSIQLAHISENVEYIGDWTFCGNSRMTTNNFTEHLKVIGQKAFASCSSLMADRTLNLPEAEQIGYGAFGWIGSKHIIIGEKCQYIGAEAFCLTGASNILLYGNPDIKGGRSEDTLAFQAWGSAEDRVSGITLWGASGSTVERYAKEHGYQFEQLDGEEWKRRRYL